MFNQGHQQGQNVFMNGGHGPQRYGMQMNSSKTFQPQQPQQQQQQQPQQAQQSQQQSQPSQQKQQQQHHHHHHQSQGHHRQQADHNGHNHASNYTTHQQNQSTSGFSSGTPHFNPSSMRNGTPNHIQNGLSRPPNEQWAQQLTLHQQARESTGTHPHARNNPGMKGPAQSAADQSKKETEREDRGRAIGAPELDSQSWTELDLGGQGLRALSSGLFHFTFLKKLFLSHNKLSYVDPAIGKLRSLNHLDLSMNNLRYLPAELGMCVNLRSLLLFDNNLELLPNELGFLFQLEMLGIEGNPLHEDLKNIVIEDGTRALISFLQETNAGPEPPMDRDWIVIDESSAHASENSADKFKILSYNILSDKAATQTAYGYTPQTALAWDFRKEIILGECRARNPDILCLQEVDQDSYNEYFRPALAHDGYRGVFWPRSRARTMTDKEAKYVDGCATLFKNSKYVLLDKQAIDFAKLAINRPDMKSEADIFNRVMPRDHIAVATFLENRQTGARLLVINVHIYWDPLFKDVKLVQVAILMEQVAQIAEEYAKWPPCKDKKPYRYADGDLPDGVEPPPMEELPEPAPSQEYASGPQIPLVVCGDFNSTLDSGVYELLSTGSLPRDHQDLAGYRYGDFTRNGMAHPFTLKSAYDTKVLPFTNYTPGFIDMIDYIWYSTNALQVTGLLGEIEKSYLQRVPGFPNVHFPSDHIALEAELNVKPRKERKAVEADFGPQKERSASRNL